MRWYGAAPRAAGKFWIIFLSQRNILADELFLQAAFEPLGSVRTA